MMYPSGIASPPVTSEVIWNISKPPRLPYPREHPQANQGKGPPQNTPLGIRL